MTLYSISGYDIKGNYTDYTSRSKEDLLIWAEQYLKRHMYALVGCLKVGNMRLSGTYHYHELSALRSKLCCF